MFEFITLKRGSGGARAGVFIFHKNAEEGAAEGKTAQKERGHSTRQSRQARTAAMRLAAHEATTGRSGRGAPAYHTAER